MNILLISLLTAPVLTLAATDAPHQDPMEQISVTATPLNRSADDLTQPTLVLDNDELLLKASSSIGETLAGELGISATYFGPVAGRPVIRGQSGPRISVLEGGVSSLDVADLSPDHAVPIEPLFAERIEVIRGPATLLYGSNATGGVVNVIDNRVPEKHGEKPLASAVELRGDSAAQERAFAGRLDGSIGAIAWHVDGFHRETDDIEIPKFATKNRGERPNSEPRGRVINSAGESQGYAGGVSIIGDRGFIGVSLSRYENDYGIPGPESDSEEIEQAALVAPGPFIEMEQTRFDLRSEVSFNGPIETLRFRFGLNDYDHVEIEPTGVTATLFENNAWETRIELVHAPIGNWHGAFGLQLNDRNFSAVGEEAFIPPTESKSCGIFMLEELPLKHGRIEFGVRMESLEHEPSSRLPSYKENAFSVASGFTWEFAANYDMTVNLSRSERHPDAAELYANGAHLATGLFEVGLLSARRHSIEHEIATNLDVSVHHHTDLLSWKLGIFYNDIANYIFRSESVDFANGLPIAPYQQRDAIFVGYEAELEFLIGDQYAPWAVRLFTDYVRGNTTDGALPRIPPARVGARLGYAGNRLSANLEGIYHAAQNDVSSFETNGFTMLNANLIVRLGDSGPALWDFFIKGTNLLNEDARRSTSFRAAFVPLPGASFHAGLRVQFN